MNAAAARLNMTVGPRRTAALAHRLGIRSALRADASLALGTSEVNLLELTSAYGALANQGQWLPPTAIRYVTDAQGKLVEEHLPNRRQACDRVT